MEIFLISDWHFSHDKPFLYEGRGFSSVEEHDEAIIERHNDVVKPDDTVFVLGDCIVGGDAEKEIEKIKRLNGKKYLAIGNHCTDRKIEIYKQNKLFEDIQFAYRFRIKKLWFYCCHYPTMVTNTNDKPVWNIHGHDHDKVHFHAFWPHCYDVSADSTNLYPKNIEEIYKEIKEYIEYERIFYER